MALVAVIALAPVLLLPNPQNVAIAQAREVREEAKAQAERLEKLAEELEKKGASADDPRTRLAQELRDLARQLREHPDQLDANLAKLGSIEAALRVAARSGERAACRRPLGAEPRTVASRDRQREVEPRRAIRSRPLRT